MIECKTQLKRLAGIDQQFIGYDDHVDGEGNHVAEHARELHAIARVGKPAESAYPSTRQRRP